MDKNKRLVDSFFELEQEKQLFMLKKGKTFVWDPIRYFIFGKLVFGNDFYAKTGAKKEKKTPVYYLKIAINLIQSTFKLLFKDYKYIFIINSRYFDQATNSYYDRNFKDILDCIRSESFVIELNKNGISKSYLGPKRFFAFPFLLGIVRLLTPKRKPYSFQNLTHILSSKFSIPEDLGKNEYYNSVLDEFELLSNTLRFIFKLIKPKAVFYGQYGLKGCVKACADLGIDSIEMQHGRTQLDHLFYSYPIGFENIRQVYTPTHFLTYSDYWYSTVNFPIAGDYVPVGNSEICQSNGNQLVKTDSLLLIDGLIGHIELSDFLLKLLENGLEDEVIYKLHPDQFFEKAQIAEKYGKFKNVTVISNKIPTPELVAKCKTVLLVQSTVAFEMLDSGGKCLILKALGHGMIEELFEHENVFLIENQEDFQSAIQQPIVPQATEDKFFLPFNKALFMNWMEKKGFL
ncbi:MAG: hypothetical protein ACI85I_002569 [Arenicella sp.]|jgi:hypothetical protein